MSNDIACIVLKDVVHIHKQLSGLKWRGPVTLADSARIEIHVSQTIVLGTRAVPGNVQTSCAIDLMSEIYIWDLYSM